MSRAKCVRQTTPADFALRRVTEHDLLEVVEIEETCGLSRWGWDAYRAELDRAGAIMLAAACEGATDGRRLCGFIAARLNGSELHINNIGVRESCRRRGIGGTLLEAALELGGRWGATQALLEVRAGNEAAQALYRHFGFEIAGRRANYYRNPPEDALLMRRIDGAAA